MVWFWRDQHNMVDNQNRADKSPDQGEVLILLSEVNKDQLRYKSDQVKSDLLDDQRCYSAGPFKDENDAKFLAIRAEALGFNSKLRSLATGGITEHWVHIPPLVNRQQSLQLLRELQARGVDSYIITQGDLAEGISLGLFKNKISAQNLTNKMRDMGYKVVLREVVRGEKELWLEFPQVTQLTEAMRNRVTGDEQELNWMLTDCTNSK